MELPRGITGFRRADEPPLPACDLRTLRGHCFVVARQSGGRVCSVGAPRERGGANFALAVLELPTGRVAVLLNAHFPVVAFAEPPGEREARLHFVDAPDVAERFGGFEAYRVATLEELSRPVTEDVLQRLAPAEREQVGYWRPRSVGELLFNFWD